MTGLVPVAVQWAFWIAVAAAGVCLAAMYSGLETGLYVLNKIRLDLLAASGNHPARVLKAMMRKFDDLLVVLLVGASLGNYLSTFAISTMFVLAGAGGRAEWYTLAAATPLLFLLGEGLPKNLFQRFPDRLVYPMLWLLRGSKTLFTACGIVPAARLIGAVARSRGKQNVLFHEGLAAVMAESQAAGTLTHSQSIMADRVIHLTEMTVADVMRPLRGVVAAGPDAKPEELFQLARLHKLSRLPIVDNTARVIGVLDVLDVLMAVGPVEPAKIMMPPVFVNARLTVTDALYHMQKAHARMAIVTDQGGRHIGIVSVKDLVEEIVGELEFA